MTDTIDSAGGLSQTDTGDHLGSADTLRRSSDTDATQSRIRDRRQRRRSAAAGARSTRTWSQRYVAALLAADVAAWLIAAGIAYSIRPAAHLHSVVVGFEFGYGRLAALSLVAWLLVLWVSGAYKAHHLAADERDYRVPVISAIRLMALVAVASYAAQASISRMIVLVYFPALICAVLLTRSAANLMLRGARRAGLATLRVLVVGDERSAAELADHLLARPSRGLEIVGVCSPTGATSIGTRGHSIPILGTPYSVIEAASALEADAVAVANPSGFCDLTLQRVAWQLERSGTDLLVAPDVVSVAGPRIQVATLRGVPLLHISEPRVDGLLRKVNSVLSRAVAASLILLSAPILVSIALAVKLDSPGPVLYRQRRVGYAGREFEMLKFRSMVDRADSMIDELLAMNEMDGALFKIRNDPRITRIGSFLRKHSLDELPQLLNVVRGHMLLVGPRPCLPSEVTKFGEAEHRRFLVKPGMTGLWQVSGRNILTWVDSVRLDLYYVDNWSPALDLRILGRTAVVVARGDGY